MSHLENTSLPQFGVFAPPPVKKQIRNVEKDPWESVSQWTFLHDPTLKYRQVFIEACNSKNSKPYDDSLVGANFRQVSSKTILKKKGRELILQ